MTPPSEGGGRHARPPAPDPLPIAVVDNHAHLDMTRDGDEMVSVGDALALARSVGVGRVVHVACDVPSIERVAQVVEGHPSLVAAVAIHPNDAARYAARGSLSSAYRVVEEALAHPRVRAVGETGLDHFRTGADGHSAQEESFRWHIDLAKRTGLPLQIHDRDAHEDVLRVLEDEGAPETVVLHCFSGDVTMAQICAERGYYLSFAGTVTFKSAKGLRDALSVVPLDRVLVETDAPYLTPHPWRGAPNAPYLVPVTVRAMAAVLGVAVPTLCQAIAENSTTVYGDWS